MASQKSIFRILNVTFHKKSSAGDCGTSHEGVFSPVSKVDIPEAQGVRELTTARLTTVGGPDLGAVLQPLEGDVLIVHIHLKCNGFFLLSVQVLQLGCNQNGCNKKNKA